MAEIADVHTMCTSQKFYGYQFTSNTGEFFPIICPKCEDLIVLMSWT